jgi:hypothetical protein
MLEHSACRFEVPSRRIHGGVAAALTLLLTSCAAHGDSLATEASEIASTSGGVAWARVEATSSSASVTHAHNSSGDPVTVARTATGRYTLVLAGQGHDLASNQGSLQVVAHGNTPARCSVQSMSRTGTPGAMRSITAVVRCYDPSTTAAADSGFVALYVNDKAGGFSSSRGYVLVQGGAVVANRTFSPTAEPTTVIPYDTGSYYVYFGGSWSASATLPLVTAYGASDNECHATDFYPETGELYVKCHAGAVESPSDFSAMLFGVPTVPAGETIERVYHTSGLTNLGHHFAAWSAPERALYGYDYRLQYGESYSEGGWSFYPDSVFAVASAYGAESQYCKLAWYSPTTATLGPVTYGRVGVICFDATGARPAAPIGVSAAYVQFGSLPYIF